MADENTMKLSELSAKITGQTQEQVDQSIKTRQAIEDQKSLLEESKETLRKLGIRAEKNERYQKEQVKINREIRTFNLQALEKQIEGLSKTEILTNIAKNTLEASKQIPLIGQGIRVLAKPLEAGIGGVKKALDLGNKERRKEFMQSLKDKFREKRAKLLGSGDDTESIKSIEDEGDDVEKKGTTIIGGIFGKLKGLLVAGGLFAVMFLLFDFLKDPKFRDILTKTWEGMKSAFEGIKKLYEKIKPVLKFLMGGILTIIGGVFTGIGDAFTKFSEGDIIGGVTTLIKTAISSITGLADLLLTSILKLFGFEGDSFFGAIKNFFTETIPNTINDIKTNISTFFTDLYTQITDFVSNLSVFKFFEETIGDMMTAIKGIFAGDFSIENVKAIFGSLFDIFTAGINLAINAVKDLFGFGDPDEPFRLSDFLFGEDGIVNKVINFFKNLFKFGDPDEPFRLSDFLFGEDGIVTKVINFFKDLFDIDFKGLLGDLLGGLGEVGSKIISFFTGDKMVPGGMDPNNIANPDGEIKNKKEISEKNKTYAQDIANALLSSSDIAFDRMEERKAMEAEFKSDGKLTYKERQELKKFDIVTARGNKTLDDLNQMRERLLAGEELTSMEQERLASLNIIQGGNNISQSSSSGVSISKEAKADDPTYAAVSLSAVY